MAETTHEPEFVTKAALLWQRILRVDHASLFAGASADIKDRAYGFDRLPQPGFVGRRYERGSLLLIGQNPGNDPIGKGMSATDQLQYQHLIALRDAGTSEGAVAAVAELMELLGSRVMPDWNIIKNVVQPLLRCLNIDLDQIAYTNIVKFRTTDSAFAKTLYGKSWELTSEQIDLLAPSIIVVLGVGTHREFQRLYRGSATLYRITRAIGDTRLPRAGAADIEAIVAARGQPITLNPKDHLMKKSHLPREVHRYDDSKALDPKVTVEILTKLEGRGLTNSHFSQLHHFASDTSRIAEKLRNSAMAELTLTSNNACGFCCSKLKFVIRQVRT